MDNVAEVCSLIKDQERWTLASHVSPDGDAIGSMLALGLGLSSLGIKIQLADSDGVPGMYSFLPGSDLIRERLLFPPDAAILLDCSDMDRAGALKEELSSAKTLINIDHHVSNTMFGNANLLDEGASATAEIVFDLLKELRVRIDADIATSLYTGIATDTGSFQFENTTQKTHTIASELLSRGTDLAAVRRYLWESVPVKSIRLLTDALRSLEMNAGGRVAWVKLPFDTYKTYGSVLEHMEGLVNYPKSIQGVEVGVIFKEIEPGKIRVGLRSKKDVDVNELAEMFGGGGHKRAAGCFLEMPLDTAVNTIVKQAEEMLGSREGSDSGSKA